MVQLGWCKQAGLKGQLSYKIQAGKPVEEINQGFKRERKLPTLWYNIDYAKLLLEQEETQFAPHQRNVRISLANVSISSSTSLDESSSWEILFSRRSMILLCSPIIFTDCSGSFTFSIIIWISLHSSSSKNWFCNLFQFFYRFTWTELACFLDLD